MEQIKIGIVGLGQFSPQFIDLFQAHPLISDVYVCDVHEDRVDRVVRRFGIDRAFSSYDELLDSDIDAVAIFTQRWLHGPMSIKALSRGKHVYSAVPMGVSVEEIQQIIELVSSTGLTYMTGETSYYYPAVVFCRNAWQQGRFGHFVFGEGEYIHDMSQGFYDAYKFSGGADWKRTASIPPMFYPTHSIANVLAVTGSYATSVSCVGFADREDDGVFNAEASLWGNTFSNESALFATADGGSMRINEFRRIGVPNERPEVRMSLFGTRGSFEQQTGSAVWQDLDGFHSVFDQITTSSGAPGHYVDEDGDEEDADDAALADAGVAEALRGTFRSGFAPVHDSERGMLPPEFDGMHNGHEGSHQFLVNDFATACATNVIPNLNAWNSARWIIPGLMAHESALAGGVRLDIPDFGAAPTQR
ncbi:Gfo/Idh/MocA family protein [uncultured Microbacterium sp.]|uniref:Gfo/Idh/MocA family protein n=1 Tax=uncultured Microbacterium sp. TaxID=191216 RepID=UPI0035CC795C